MRKWILTYFSASAVPFFISAPFFFGGHGGAGVLSLVIGLASIYMVAYRSRRGDRRNALCVRSGWALALSGTTLAWMGLIFYLSSLTQPETPQVPLLGNWQSLVGHLVLYGICAALIEGSIWTWVSEHRLRWAFAAAAATTAYGISDEYHQSFVAGRHATVEDALVNTIAAMAAAFDIWWIAAHRTRLD